MRVLDTLAKSAVSTSILALAAAALPAPAFAQADAPAQPEDELALDAAAEPQTAQDEQTIFVTGSRIPRANFDTPQPAVVLGSEQIELRGYTNLGDALGELPAFGVPGNNPVGGQSGAFGSGQTFVNFFGLGDQRTLTVVNSRRFVSSNTASIFGPTGSGSQVDFNVIPTLIVDRVETIAVGGAPIYGSDAIAGTVNVITKRDFNGIVVDGQAGVSEYGDAAEYRLGLLAGRNFGGGRGNITVALEYNRQNGLVGESRPNSGLGRFFTTCAPPSEFDQCLIQDRRIPALSQYGVPLSPGFVADVGLDFPLSPGQVTGLGFFGPDLDLDGNGVSGTLADISILFGGAGGPGAQAAVTDINGNPLAFDAAGNLIPINFGQSTGNLINFDGGNGFALPENLLTQTRRYIGTALAQYQVSDSIRVFGEFWYANSRGYQLRDQPVYNTGLFDSPGTPDGNIILSIDNPFLNPAARQAILDSCSRNVFCEDTDTFLLGRANTDIIPSDGFSTVELWRVVAGIDGDFELFGRNMAFELVGNYGKSTTQGRERVLIQQNFENAINAVTDANGNIVCAPGGENAPIASINPQCFPINPFGHQIDPRAIDYVTTFADPRAENDQAVFTASVSGSLFDVWGGPVGFAIGYEHREESAEFDPGVYYFGLPDPDDPDGDRTQFGRSIPIDPVSGEFNTDEVFGELTVPLIGRDQNIPLIYSFELNGAARYIDHSLAGGDLTWTAGATWQPIRDITFRGNFTRSVRAPAVTELFNPTSAIFTTANDPCDSRFRDAGPNPATRQANCAADGLPADFQSNIVDFTARGTLQGNTELENEKADAWTVGAILRPRFLPGLTMTVDWVDIELEGAIQSLNAVQTLQACYDDPDFPTAICNQFTRDENGQITFIQTGFANAASRTFAALLAELQWRVATPFLGAQSALNLGVNYIYYDELEFRVGQGDLTTLRNSIGYSPHQFTANLTYYNQGFRGQVQAQYIGPTRFDPDEEVGTRDFDGVGDKVFVNTSFSYDVNQQFQIRLIVDNVFDARPPFPSPGGGGRITYFDGIMGRYFKVGARVRF